MKRRFGLQSETSLIIAHNLPLNNLVTIHHFFASSICCKQVITLNETSRFSFYLLVLNKKYNYTQCLHGYCQQCFYINYTFCFLYISNHTVYSLFYNLFLHKIIQFIPNITYLCK